MIKPQAVRPKREPYIRLQKTIPRNRFPDRVYKGMADTALLRYQKRGPSPAKAEIQPEINISDTSYNIISSHFLYYNTENRFSYC